MIGDIDYLMIPYIKRINKLPGFYTLYCCSGHNTSYNSNGYIHIKAKEREKAYRILSQFEDDFDSLCSIDEYPILCVRWHYKDVNLVMDELVTTLEANFAG
jgi:hypothetical protein